MSPDEFDLFLTYLYIFGNKCVKYKLSFFFQIFLMTSKGFLRVLYHFDQVFTGCDV
jgi:hypothetical protein